VRSLWYDEVLFEVCEDREKSRLVAFSCKGISRGGVVV
jgi:hypothetical protein